MTREELAAFLYYQLVIWYDAPDPATKRLADHLAARLHAELAKHD